MGRGGWRWRDGWRLRWEGEGTGRDCKGGVEMGGEMERGWG